MSKNRGIKNGQGNQRLYIQFAMISDSASYPFESLKRRRK